MSNLLPADASVPSEYWLCLQLITNNSRDNLNHRFYNRFEMLRKVQTHMILNEHADSHNEDRDTRLSRSFY